jgi:DNA-directed RNA polymerase subunit alpha
MQNIALPKKIEFKAGDTSGEGQIIVEPLYPGYGMTLGNSLRRVLLSSLPGAAVIGVKIKGVSHEFMAIPGLKEDILEVILNLKQLRLRVFTEEEVTLTLKAKGQGEITAANIDKNSDVEITNPELVIANLTEASASLEMEI